MIVVVCNFTPVPRFDYHTGVPHKGKWVELFNSDDAEFGGSNVRNMPEMEAWDQVSHNRPFTLSLALPPLGVVYLKYRPDIPPAG
jgi:1,4-alpha-glucan branching enzyme